jgi:hypothetical protein
MMWVVMRVGKVCLERRMRSSESVVLMNLMIAWMGMSMMASAASCRSGTTVYALVVAPTPISCSCSDLQSDPLFQIVQPLVLGSSTNLFLPSRTAHHSGTRRGGRARDRVEREGGAVR